MMGRRSRRGVLGGAVAAAVSLLAVVACGGSGGGPAGAPGANTDNGVLRMAFDLSGTATPVTFDPAGGTAAGAQVAWQLPIYDSLLHYDTSGALVPGLATSATISDPSTVTVTLRSGLVFSDGTTLDANAVKASILRNKAEPQHGQLSAVLQNVSTIDVASPTSLTIHLSKPNAGAFYALLAGPETFVSPASADLARSPVGAGPFMLAQYVPQQRMVLKKNPRYWGAKDIHLAEIDIVSVSAGPQQVNAIKSGQVNFSLVQPADIPAIRSDSSLRLVTHTTDTSLLWMPLCKSEPPLDKPLVRQALSYAVDRDAINQAVLQGAGEPAVSFWPKDSVFYPKSLPAKYAFDVAKAKQLLAQAGYPSGFDLTLVLLPSSPVASQTAQIIQSAWKAIGVNVTIKQSSNFVSDLYINHLGQTSIVPAIGTGVDKFKTLTPGNVGDLCGYENPELTKISTQLQGIAPNSPAAASLWADAQSIISRDALAIWLDFLPTAAAVSPSLADLNLVTSYLVPVPDYHTVRVGRQ